MTIALTLPLAARLPLPGDAALAQRGFERIASGPAVLQALADKADGRALLAAVLGNSPFLGQALFNEPDIVEAFLTQEPAAVLADLLDRLKEEAIPASEPSAMAKSLRRAKRRVALLIALADIAGH